ncbi:hypothetical protein Salat_0037200 [Sesamum alatum]|uniref:Uncharacterized protein n=1 Tax=Sesamum alatum TaxID=300844 RepID=A0AAE1YW03_9LAMI|nr:hypothetical protein Salat_0037200 [Sesamum alatum]
MNARIEWLSRALRGGSVPVVATRSSEVEDSVTQGGDPPGGSSGHPATNSPTPTEVAGTVARVTATPSEYVLALGANPDPTGSKEVEVAEVVEGGGAAFQEASPQRQKTSQQRLTSPASAAREELRIPSSRTAEMEGEKLDPGWAISARSSMLRSLVGQDSWELYKACLLERDQVLLAQTSHTRVEEHIAHVLTQAMAFNHDLSLKCSMFRHQRGVAESKILELQKDVLDAQQKEKATIDGKSALEAQIAELKSSLRQATEVTKKSVAEALEQGKAEGFSAGRVAGRTEGLMLKMQLLRSRKRMSSKLSSPMWGGFLGARSRSMTYDPFCPSSLRVPPFVKTVKTPFARTPCSKIDCQSRF